MQAVVDYLRKKSLQAIDQDPECTRGDEERL